MHEIQEKATTHKVFMKIIRPWPGRSGYLEKFSDLTSNGMARFRFEGDNYADSRLVRLQRCGGVEMLRKIVDFAKKIFRMEPIPTTVNTMWEALRDLEVARNHFENCDPEFITAAIFELNAAESRLDAARRCVG